VINEKGAPTKALIIAPHPKREELAHELGPRFEGQLNVVRSDPEYLEFLHPEVNKGEIVVNGLRIITTNNDNDDDDDRLL